MLLHNNSNNVRIKLILQRVERMYFLANNINQITFATFSGSFVFLFFANLI